MNMAQFIVFSPVISISGAVLVVMLTIAVRRNFVLVSFIAGIGILVSLAAVSIIWSNSPVQVTPLFRMDTYGLFYTALLFMAGLAVTAFCYDYF
jgi:NADH-quinone oxidoreductase subunit N